MPQSIVLGNGSVLVGFDGRARIKDLYFDYVGLEDHMTPEAVCKIGVWIEGNFSWFEDAAWQFSIDYKENTLLSKIIAKNEKLNIEVEFEDLVYNEKNIIVRNFIVKNLENHEREIKIYFNHQFRMYGMHKKDTVYYDPADQIIMHYKGRRVALIGGEKNGESFTDFSVGLSNIEGKSGTWKDAEDGRLSRNPIEHGTVDSTISFEETVDANKNFSGSIWICMGKGIDEVQELHKLVKQKTTAHITNSTSEFWKAWLKCDDYDLSNLDPEIHRLYNNSLLIIRTHTDNTGGIIASCDSGMLQYGRDNYTYIWHRDASLVAMAIDRAGHHSVARKFFEFCEDTINDEGYFFHKYRSDRALGSSWHGWIDTEGRLRLPIQEDETALVIIALWKHYQHTRDIEYIESVYNSLIRKIGNFLIGYRLSNKLPKPTYDLWEQRWGIHTFTASTVYAALVDLAKFANLLGKAEEEAMYTEAAEDMKNAIINNLYSEKQKYFYKYIDFEDGKVLHDETIDTSSLYGIFRYGVLDVNDDKVLNSYETLKNTLCCNTNIGGVMRYEEDEYYKIDETAPSNPWIITTLWKAQFIIQSAKKKKDLAEAFEILTWTAKRANQAGLLSEQVNPHWGEGLSATPLIWSHAEFVTTVIDYIEKLKEFEK